MTFTQTYIPMMKESPIQKEWKPKVGDWYYHKDKTIWMICPHYIHMNCPSRIWLLTSDDWWEMINFLGGVVLTIYKLFDENTYVLETSKYSNHFMGQSPLELLFAFYHFEKWGMRWDGGWK